MKMKDEIAKINKKSRRNNRGNIQNIEPRKKAKKRLTKGEKCGIMYKSPRERREHRANKKHEAAKKK